MKYRNAIASSSAYSLRRIRPGCLPRPHPVLRSTKKGQPTDRQAGGESEWDGADGSRLAE